MSITSRSGRSALAREAWVIVKIVLMRGEPPSWTIVMSLLGIGGSHPTAFGVGRRVCGGG
jgi:hypothetical protein